MLIGIDFDNTIVCYDGIFHAVARERDLIPSDIPVNKGAVRDHLRATGREPLWTEMQGFVYGPALARAEPYPGVWDFFKACAKQGVAVRIVSHKTAKPYAGPPYDLQASAREWIKQQTAAQGIKLDIATEVFLEPTKAEKLQRIGALACDWFIDDLPEFLAEPGFPAQVNQILFDPTGTAPTGRARRATSWADITKGLFGPKPWARQP